MWNNETNLTEARSTFRQTERIIGQSAWFESRDAIGWKEYRSNIANRDPRLNADREFRNDELERNVLTLWPILLGWPAILVSIVLSVTGIVRRRSGWLIVSVITVLPITLYLFGTPRFRWIAPLLPLLLIGVGISIRRSLHWLAWSLFIPFVGFFGWLAVIVISE